MITDDFWYTLMIFDTPLWFLVHPYAFLYTQIIYFKSLIIF